jgi:hypothetical protein
MNIRVIDAFLGALKAVRTQVQSNPDTTEPLDYERIIQDKMQEYTAAQAGSQLDIRDEKFCREIRSFVGIKEHASRGKKGDDSDQVLEVLRPRLVLSLSSAPLRPRSMKCLFATRFAVMSTQKPVLFKCCMLVRLVASCPDAGIDKSQWNNSRRMWRQP